MYREDREEYINDEKNSKNLTIPIIKYKEWCIWQIGGMTLIAIQWRIIYIDRGNEDQQPN